MNAAQSEIAIVIPAYQESATIATIIAGVRAAMPTAVLLIVDDGSTDGTGAIAEAAGARVLRPSANAGKGAALRNGMRAAMAEGATWVLTMDADGQHRAQDLPRLVAVALATPRAIIIGSRRADQANAPAARRRANRVADFWVSWAAGCFIADSQSGFRAYPAVALQSLDRYEGRSQRFSFESAILIDAARDGFAIHAIDIPALYGAMQRHSHFRPVADITRIVLMVAGRLLAWGMYPQGLWRSLRPPRH
ncbi:glycosyltransferase family 2 protein [Plastoroseomonas arctica]|uniref:Glycosyltransferase family 2 protein n=1 Tax=Plastoroseomonas arctica TaxID=1509237 RepID=A0AAF1KQ38_9PROT|nr:glycosyltransferase family 2 protein [Plastoroseomonas arctica]MBR0656998.1 glycosyltransferase family 2 protein [Plastoroseomonas arctica]